jgi:hypothetical protein
MPSRVAKRVSPKTSARDRLLLTLLANAGEMPACTVCERSGRTCVASPSDSSRCAECVRQQRGNCDIFGPSDAQLRNVATQFRASEHALDQAEEEAEQIRLQLVASEAKIRRLRKQRRMWADKVSRMVHRGLSSLEELDSVEAQEAQGQAVVVATAAPAPDFAIDWDDPLLFPLGHPSELSSSELAFVLALPETSGASAGTFSGS